MLLTGVLSYLAWFNFERFVRLWQRLIIWTIRVELPVWNKRLAVSLPWLMSLKWRFRLCLTGAFLTTGFASVLLVVGLLKNV
jgi:hypothetical protein